MGQMHMQAGEAMSMWTRMPGQSWPGFAASFLGMWLTMMVPMMIPPFAVMLWRYRAAARRQGATHLGMASVMVTLGYFAVWSAIGVILCPLAAILLRRTGAGAAWRDGVRLAIHCVRSCAPLMAIAFVVGGTDYRVMAAVTAAITALRLTPRLPLQVAAAPLRHAGFVGDLLAVALEDADGELLHQSRNPFR